MRHAPFVAALAAAAVALAACDQKHDDAAPPSALASPLAAPELPGGLRVTGTEHGWTPSTLSLPQGAAGSTTTVTFVRTTDKTCATEVVFPDLGMKKELLLNQPVAVQVPTDTARTLTFQCGMAMYKGKLVVK